MVPVKSVLSESIEIESNQFLKIEKCTLLLIFSLLERNAWLCSFQWSLVVENENHFNTMLSTYTIIADSDTTRRNDIGFPSHVLDRLSRNAKPSSATREDCKVRFACARNVEIMGERGVQ